MCYALSCFDFRQCGSWFVLVFLLTGSKPLISPSAFAVLCKVPKLGIRFWGPDSSCGHLEMHPVPLNKPLLSNPHALDKILKELPCAYFLDLFSNDEFLKCSRVVQIYVDPFNVS